MSVYLERIILKIPDSKTSFNNTLASLFTKLGHNEGGMFRLTSSNHDFYPEIQLDFYTEQPDITTDFILSKGEIISVKVENTTGVNKQSPYTYRHIEINAVVQRLADSGIHKIGIDHVGINLPWFSPGIHPNFLALRETLSSHCLYHRFPTGEPWDFILPGYEDEIANRMEVDYTKIRRPKFELVSFNNASTPLIQFDIGVNADYEKILNLFPESLNDPELRNVWVYLETPYPTDVCLVINQHSDLDWSDFFEGNRL